MPKSAAKEEDQHKSKFMVRLPEFYRVKLQELKDKTDRPMAVMVRRALDAYLKANGIEPPPAM